MSYLVHYESDDNAHVVFTDENGASIVSAVVPDFSLFKRAPFLYQAVGDNDIARAMNIISRSQRDAEKSYADA